MALSEPILVAFGVEGAFLDAQIAVLAVSTALFFIGLSFTYAYISSSVSPTEKLELIFSREVIGEIICILIGWALIFTYPAVAALRCFRIFRLLWYLSHDPKTREADYKPEEHWVSIRQTCNICVNYLQNLGEELFSARSRGGLVVIALFFYTAYIFAVIFTYTYPHLETVEGAVCGHLQGCFFTLLRFSFYDGEIYSVYEWCAYNMHCMFVYAIACVVYVHAYTYQ